MFEKSINKPLTLTDFNREERNQNDREIIREQTSLKRKGWLTLLMEFLVAMLWASHSFPCCLCDFQPLLLLK